MSTNRKKSGYPLKEKYENYLYIQKYLNLINKLKNEINYEINEEDLVNIIFKLQVFLEVYFFII